MRKLFKYQKINSFFGKLLSAALSFVMIASITRNLDLEESGKFLSSYSIFLVLLSFATYGLKHEVVKLFSSGISLTEKSKIFLNRVAFGQLISWGLVVFFTLLYLSPLRTQLPESFQSLSVIIFSLPLACFISFYSAHLQGLQRIFMSLFFLTILFYILFILGSFLPSLQSLLGYSTLFIASYFIVLAFSIVNLKINKSLYIKDSPKLDLYLFDEKKNFAISDLAGVSLAWIPAIILTFYESYEELSIYVVANRIVAAIQLIPISLSYSSQPNFKFQKNNKISKEQSEKVYKDAQYTSIAIVIPLVIFLLYCPDLILNFFGSEYEKAKDIMIILSISLLLNTVMGPQHSFNLVAGNEKFIMQVSVMAIIAIIISSIALYPTYGLISIAYVILVGTFLTNLFGYIKFRNSINND